MTRPVPAFDPRALREIPDEIMKRYDVPGPRYTSYPTAPVWSDDFGEADHITAMRNSATSGRPLSVYVHLPFCESLCIYCGCNVVITKRREQAAWYLDRLEDEIRRTADLCGAYHRKTVQVAWGGGTPTYLAPDQVEYLMGLIGECFPLSKDAEVAIEVDPRVTTREHVEAIVRAGFNRISMGIQDFDPAVQEEIHRVQPYEMTRDLIQWCREEGLDSVNVDLVYGLPLQTADKFEKTIDLVQTLEPDRISAFSYAHVPWLKPQQRKFKDADLPQGPEKFEIFTRLVERMTGAGYEFIGMDHFAKPDNELAVALRTGALWRNFQGFTTKAGTDLVGMGVTSIGSFDDAFTQNVKDLQEWNARLDASRMATHRGMWLSDDDRIRRDVIQDIMCRYRFDPDATSKQHEIDAREYFAKEIDGFGQLEADGMLVQDGRGGFELTSRGRLFVRNVCMTFDAHLDPNAEKPVFSRTV
jgi:oxygen-independent coproporphyrinogen-3 oxidase